MSEFTKGQRVLCVRGYRDLITGNTYTVDFVDELGYDTFVHLEGSPSGHYEDRFTDLPCCAVAKLPVEPVLTLVPNTTQGTQDTQDSHDDLDSIGLTVDDLIVWATVESQDAEANNGFSPEYCEGWVDAMGDIIAKLKLIKVVS